MNEASSTPSVPPTPTIPSTIPESEAADPDSYILDWNTPAGAYHNVRVLCDRAGLSVAAKNIICACIFQESRFNTMARHDNVEHGQVTSTDWGLCQINDYFHIGRGKDFPSVAYVIGNPQDAVQFMIEMQKAGKLSLWSSYATGAYKQWLAPNSPMWQLAINTMPVDQLAA